MVVKALNREDLARSSIRHIIKDIKSMSSLLQIHSSHTKEVGQYCSPCLSQESKVFFSIRSLDEICST